ncbi:MAG: efflux RND transporter permease subunit [Bacteroidaceae bacterium]|nr:efflux RND transporter permease subunit [Bacteroidaceae bacterium]
MKITKFFMDRPTAFWSFMVMIILAGALAFSSMPKLEDPAVAVKQAMVIIPYQGATAHEVELKVVQPMEDVLRTLPQVRKLKSECQSGMAMITIEYSLEAKGEDLEQYFDLLRRKVNDNKSVLPQDCMNPIVMDDMMDVYGIFYSLTGDGYTYNELEKYAKYIRRNLLTVKGVKRITIAGTRREVININIDKEKIAQNGLIPTQIMMQLQGAGATVNAGNLDIAQERLQVTVNDAVQNENDIRELKISTIDGKTTRLGDIATVTREYSEPQTQGFFVNGKPALAICVSMNDDAVVPDVGKLVDEKLNETLKSVPAGMETDKIFFQPDKVDAAITSFMMNLIESVLIVIIVLIFAMGFRSGLIIGFGLVLTICLSFPILLEMGTTLQRISLGAFIIAMGMLVDNAIVIMDGILVDRAKGLPASTYLYRIGKQTAMPLLGATIIGASTFICIYMTPGSTGEYAGDLFLVLCVSLLVSWALALVQVPVCANAFLPKREESGEQKEPMSGKFYVKMREIIVKMVDHKNLAICVSVLALVLCGAGFMKVKNLFFPDFDYKQFVIEYQLPVEAGPDRVKHDLLEITDTLLKNKDIERVCASMGSAPAHYCLVRPMKNGGNSYGELTIDCKDFKTVEKVIPIIRKQLRESYPEATVRFKKYNFSISTSHTVEVMFSGPDPAVLRELSAKAEAIMKKSEYIDAYSVQNNWKAPAKMLVADYIQQDALRSRIQRGDVGNALLAATDGMTCGVLNEGDKQILINLKMQNEDGTKITDLTDIPVWSTINLNLNADDLSGIMMGNTKDLQKKLFRSTPLSNVTDGVNLQFEEPFIYRYNGQRAIEAECDPNPYVDAATPAKVLDDIQDAIDQIELPDGYSRQWVGEQDTSSEATTMVFSYLPLTFFLIFIILLLLFNSWKKVFLIIVCVPFVICGITPALLGLNIPFTFMAIIGFEGLIGMVCKNTIVLVDEVTRLIDEEHQNPYDAVINATVSRIRPVTMASLTTILGMAPLLSDPMYNSMAVCIMGGLTMGTIITLLLMPVFYTAVYRIKRPTE